MAYGITPRVIGERGYRRFVLGLRRATARALRGSIRSSVRCSKGELIIEHMSVK